MTVRNCYRSYCLPLWSLAIAPCVISQNCVKQIYDLYGCWMRAKPPSHSKINDFIKYELTLSLEEVFNEINAYVFDRQNVDLQHAYIDGTKLQAKIK